VDSIGYTVTDKADVQVIISKLFNYYPESWVATSYRAILHCNSVTSSPNRGA